MWILVFLSDSGFLSLPIQFDLAVTPAPVTPTQARSGRHDSLADSLVSCQIVDFCLFSLPGFICLVFLDPGWEESCTAMVFG